MKLPYINLCDSVAILVTLDNGIDDNGNPIILGSFEGMCNFSEKTKRVYNSDGQLISLEGKAIIKGDVAPGITCPEGKALINGKEYKIYKVGRFRNPDGTIHHCELELM